MLRTRDPISGKPSIQRGLTYFVGKAINPAHARAVEEELHEPWVPQPEKFGDHLINMARYHQVQYPNQQSFNALSNAYVSVLPKLFVHFPGVESSRNIHFYGLSC